MLPSRLAIVALALGLSAAFAAPAARATDCGADMQKFTVDRMNAMKSINDVVAAAKGKQMDPAVFCAKSRPLLDVENKMIAYMEKNLDWCQIPEQLITQLKDAHGKSASFSAKACTVAAQMKKAQEAGGAAGQPAAQPLPAGPL